MQFAQNHVDVLHRPYHTIMHAEVTDDVLPCELLEQIISTVWLSPMHPKERKHFVTSVSLVSKLWLAVFTRIRARDTFMVSSSLERYSALISTSYHSKNRLFPYLHSICRSFTLQIIMSTPKPSRAHVQAGPTSFSNNIYRKYNRDILATFHLLPFLPNLRTLSIIYFTEKGPSLPRPQCPLRFDVPVVCMDLEYTVAADVPLWIVDELGLSPRASPRWAKQRHVPWEVPDLEHVSFPDDTDDTTIGAFLNAYSQLELTCGKERFMIKVKIISASRHIPQHATIVHGAMEPSSISTFTRDGCYPTRHDRTDLPGMSSAPRVVRGMALGFLFDNMSDRRRAPMEQDVSHNCRAVYVFMSRRSPG